MHRPNMMIANQMQSQYPGGGTVPGGYLAPGAMHGGGQMGSSGGMTAAQMQHMQMQKMYQMQQHHMVPGSHMGGVGGPLGMQMHHGVPQQNAFIGGGPQQSAQLISMHGQPQQLTPAQQQMMKAQNEVKLDVLAVRSLGHLRQLRQRVLNVFELLNEGVPLSSPSSGELRSTSPSAVPDKSTKSNATGSDCKTSTNSSGEGTGGGNVGFSEYDGKGGSSGTNAQSSGTGAATSSSSAVAVVQQSSVLASQTFVKQLKDNLGEILDDHERLDRCLSYLPKGPVPLVSGNDNTLLMGSLLDPAETYCQTLGMLDWSGKVSSRFYYTHALAAQSNLVALNRRIARSIARPYPENFAKHVFQYTQVVSYVETLNKQNPNLETRLQITNLTPVSKNKPDYKFKLTVSHILQAVVVVQGPFIELILVKHFTESFSDDDGLGLDLMTPSRFVLFQKITNYLRGFIYASTVNLLQNHGLKAINNTFVVILTILNSYRSLFSDKCSACGKYLRDNQPPFYRENRVQQPCHEACRPS